MFCLAFVNRSWSFLSSRDKFFHLAVVQYICLPIYLLTRNRNHLFSVSQNFHVPLSCWETFGYFVENLSGSFLHTNLPHFSLSFDWCTMYYRCSFVNFWKNIQCLKCKAKGPKMLAMKEVEMKKGDWNCPQ